MPDEREATRGDGHTSTPPGILKTRETTAPTAAADDRPQRVACTLPTLFATLTGIGCGAWCAHLAAGWCGWWAAPPVFLVVTYVATYVPGLPLGFALTFVVLALLSPPSGGGSARS